MEDQLHDALHSEPRVKATLRLGSELFSVNSETGILSEQLAIMKEKSMSILKDYITKHNAPNDVPDALEGSSGDESEEPDNPPKKSKKQK